MISYEQALEIIRKAGAEKPLLDETVPVGAIAGRVCAADITAPMANQPFDNAAMDGFALKADDLARAANDNPVALEMIGHIAAGDVRAYGAPASGQCYEIMTGAPLPPGCDAVVQVEKTRKSAGNKILFDAATISGENIRRAGEDIREGDFLFAKGTPLHSGHVLALSTVGIAQVAVKKKPLVALISTGSEVVDDCSAPLEAGQIYNSTRPYLTAALAAQNTEVRSCGTVTDDPASFRNKLSCMIDNKVDIAISTGAVSAGVHDFIPTVLKEMGAEILFHKVAIRPGKPILFARFPDGGPLFVGLPGNPVSSAAGLRFFVQPLIRSLLGLPPEQPRYAVLKAPYKKGKAGLRFFIRAKRHNLAQGLNEVEIPAGQQSFKVRPFIDTDVWVSVSEEIEFLDSGSVIEVYQ